MESCSEKKLEIEKNSLPVPTTGDYVEAKNRRKKADAAWMEVYTTFIASFSFMCIGLLRAYTSPALSSMKDKPEIFNTTTLSEKQVISWFASSPPMASFIGTIVSGPFLQHCGRQTTLVLLTLPYVLGWLLIGFAQNMIMVLAGRLLTGFAAGVSTAGAQLYVGECVRPQIRGTLGFLPAMMLAFGVLIGFAASNIDVEWRQLSLIMGTMPLCLFGLTLTIPESPVWLIIHGKVDQAVRNMQRLRGSTAIPQEIDDEVQAIHQVINERKKSKRMSIHSLRQNQFWRPRVMRQAMTNFCRTLKRREIWYPGTIAVMLMFFQQAAAANVVIFFCTVILEHAEPAVSNFPKDDLLLDHNLGSVIVGLVQFGAFFLSLPLIDRLGRKVLLVASAICMAICFALMGFYFYVNYQVGLMEIGISTTTKISGVNFVGNLPLVQLQSNEFPGNFDDFENSAFLDSLPDSFSETHEFNITQGSLSSEFQKVNQTFSPNHNFSALKLVGNVDIKEIDSNISKKPGKNSLDENLGKKRLFPELTLHQGQYENINQQDFEGQVEILNESLGFYPQVLMLTCRWLPITTLSLFIASYSVGFGPVPFLVMSEVFPAKVRSYLCAVASFANHFFLFIVIKMFPALVDAWGSHWTFWAFGASSLASIIFVLAVVPETKGKSLAEIERFFMGETAPLLSTKEGDKDSSNGSSDKNEGDSCAMDYHV